MFDFLMEGKQYTNSESNVVDSQLTVVSYNVFLNGYNNHITLDAIVNLDADIVILQEANKCNRCKRTLQSLLKDNIRLNEMMHNFDYYYRKCKDDHVLNEIATIVCGDFNGRTGKCHQYLSKDLLVLKSLEVKNNCCGVHAPSSWRGMF
eukprot:887535_1